MKKFFLLLFTVVLGLSINAQRTCGTVQHEQMLLQNDPHYATHKQVIEQFTQNYILSGAPHNQRSIITIPVVVHVIYSNAAGNISTAQIQSQIDRLNLDYHKLNADTASVPAPWKSLAADCQIQFCLAQRDPNGSTTTGIVRKSTTVSSWSTNDAVKYTAQGGDDAWPSSSYLNLWVCDLGNSLLGYAQFPGGTAATDGVVILNTAFGSTGTAAAPYDLGRTATHEVGHWLNLIHIWGDDNGACTGSDLVNDTPNQADKNFGCPTYPHTDACSTTSPGVMFMDYMDYVDDACMYMFTNGQNARIQANFANGGARVSLLNSQGCVPVSGGPVTAFTANKTTVCVGQSINFTDQSTGNPTSWSWVINGGTPASSAAQNPQNVVFNTAGVYSVTLTATNTGGSTPLIKTNYITVLGTTPLPVKEGFESTTFPPTGWSIGNPDNATTWVRTTSASGFGTSTACAFVDNYNYTTRKQKDYLYSPVYSFVHGLNASSKLKFDYAYALDQSGDYDTLQVMYSTDCGTTWVNLWKKGGTQLTTTATTYGSSFVPTATQWVRDSTISLASLVGQVSVQFAFININDYGNSILLDNINIDTVVASVACIKPTAAFVPSATTVTQGSAITYTDQSTHSPTTWAWTFSGGSPATSTVQAAGAITYNTLGTFTTKLKVTNACGADSTTVSVTVIAAGGTSSCDTLSHLVVGDSARLYTAGAQWGFLSGSNGYGDLAKAEKYSNLNGKPISSVIFGFGYAHSAGATDSLTVNIWDANGLGGRPGTILGTAKVSMNTVVTNTMGTTYHFTTVNFPCPVTTGATFYAGFNINYIAGDTIAVLTTSQFNGINHPYQSYELNAGTPNVWAAVDTDWNFSLSDYIFPIQCTQSAPVAAFSANKTTLCIGDSVTLTDLSTNCPTSWSWQITGPVNQVSSVKNPKLTFTSAGTYTVILTASNAGGNNSHTQTAYITVKSPPSVTTTTTPVNCFGGTDGTATANATGAISYTYVWTGGTTLNPLTAKPTGNYSVTVTDNFNCTASAIAFISQPFNALSATANASSAYCGNANGSHAVTATGGNGGYTYLWAPGGQTTASVNNVAAGYYTVTVKDNKNCSVVVHDTVTSQTANVIINFINTSATCGLSNGSAVATINGTSNGAHYHWSRGDSSGSITSVAPGIYSVTITNYLGCSAVKSDTVKNIAGPSVTASFTPVSCFGGSDGTATAVAQGGTGTITYAWTGGSTANPLTGKPMGIYTVTVTDANLCTATATTTITQPSAPVAASATSTPVICTTLGTATAAPTGGNGGFTYLWSPGGQTGAMATNLAANTYTVTVKDSKQCSATAVTTVANNSINLSVSATATHTGCTLNTGTAIASTSATGITYTWSPGGSHAPSISSLGVGTYTVTISNSNGCSASASASVTTSSPPTASATATPVTCFAGTDGTATAIASGGTGTLSYAWSGGGTANNITAKPAGIYTVTVTDAVGCTVTATTSIGGPTSALLASATSTPVTCTQAGTATVAAQGGNAANYTYIWNTGFTIPTITGLAATTYTVTVKDAKQCSATATTTVVNNAASLSVNITTTNSACGGSTGTATAHTTATGVTYTWSPGGAHTPSLSLQSAGTYSVTIVDGNGCSASATNNIQNSNGVQITTSSTPVTCFGGTDGTASVVATSGTGTYTYAWSGGGNGATVTKPAGSYTVTVSDGTACSATALVTILQPISALATTTTTTPVICTTAGTATALPTGGNIGGYTYLWSANSQTNNTATALAATTYTVTVKDSKQCSTTATATVLDQSLSLSVSIAKTDPSCGSTNGNATANTSATGITYTWSPGGSHASSLANLGMGTYTVTITNTNGCSASATTTLQATSGPSALATSTPVTCFGGTDGTATVMASGGSGSYTYAWSGGGGVGFSIAGKPAGSYTVTVSDGTCSTTASATIGGPASALTVSISSTPVICTHRGTATVVAQGGNTGNYTYLWSPGGQTSATDTGLVANTYAVTVSDSKGCSAVTSTSVNNQNSTLTAAVLLFSPIRCHGQSNATIVAVTPSPGFTPYTYTWSVAGTSDTLHNMGQGAYTTTITDAMGCTATGTITVFQPTILTDSITATKAASSTSPTGTATIHPLGGSTPYSSFSWSNTQQGLTITGLLAGTYYCTITDNAGCQTIDSIHVGFLTGISDIEPTFTFTVKPNPITDLCTISIQLDKAATVELQLFNILGQRVWTKELSNSKSANENIDTQQFAVGVYILHITVGDRTYSTRVVKQ